MLSMEEKYYFSPFGGFNSFLKAKLEYHAKYGIEIWFIFLIGINLVPKM